MQVGYHHSTADILVASKLLASFCNEQARLGLINTLQSWQQLQKTVQRSWCLQYMQQFDGGCHMVTRGYAATDVNDEVMLCLRFQ